MRRRDFITLLGGAAAATPFGAHAQLPAKPVIGFLHLTSLEETKEYLAAFHQGLSDTGYTRCPSRQEGHSNNPGGLYARR
jgi:putative ABC transport system substrate-binding protein